MILEIQSTSSPLAAGVNAAVVLDAAIIGSNFLVPLPPNKLACAALCCWPSPVDTVLTTMSCVSAASALPTLTWTTAFNTTVVVAFVVVVVVPLLSLGESRQC